MQISLLTFNQKTLIMTTEHYTTIPALNSRFWRRMEKEGITKENTQNIQLPEGNEPLAVLMENDPEPAL